MKSSDRSRIAPFYVMEVMKAAAERERAGGDVLHLEVGQPSTPAPKGVLDAAAAALTEHRLGYTDALGVPGLRNRISHFYTERHHLAIPPERIIVTVGASAGCVLSFLAAFDAGDRVAVTEPGYPCYRNMLEAFGVEVVGIPVGPGSRFVLTPDHLAAAGPLAGVVVASPANPTGTAFTTGELAMVAAYCEAEGIRLISDEIYQGIDYSTAPPSTSLAHTSQGIVVQSFSKYYSMTGWRLGWLVVPEELLTPIERLAQNLFISPPTLSQLSGVAAFDCTDELEANVDRYRTNRSIVLEGLARAGFQEVAPADGGFYVYANVAHLTDDSQDLCATWLRDLGVAVTPGIDFDPRRGHHYIRISYSEGTGDVAEAIHRVESWCAGRTGRSPGLDGA